MTVQELSEQLRKLKPELQGKKILVLHPNGEYYSPSIKFELVDPYKMDKTKENVKSVILIS